MNPHIVALRILAGRPDHATLEEDEVELPGGGQASIDDLERDGRLTDALLRKARPDVYEQIQLDRGPMTSGETMLPGGDRRSVNDLEVTGEMTPSLYAKSVDGGGGEFAVARERLARMGRAQDFGGPGSDPRMMERAYASRSAADAGPYGYAPEHDPRLEALRRAAGR